MQYSFPYRMGPLQTDKILKTILITIISCTAVAAVVDPLLNYIFNIRGVEFLFGLSKEGLSHFYLWQPATYMFFFPVGWGGISFGFLINIAFCLYLLWLMGSHIIERIGAAHFAYFFVGTGIAAGLVSVLFTDTILLGPYASLFAIFVLWTMMGPENEIWVFFLFPIMAKWLLAFLGGAILLSSLSQGDYATFCLYLAGSVIAYLYGVIHVRLPGPYEWMQPIDTFVSGTFEKLAQLVHYNPKVKPTKIYDLRTGQPVMDDDQFIDAMLAKIAKHGEDSLSWSEKKRMDDIAIKRKHKNEP